MRNWKNLSTSRATLNTKMNRLFSRRHWIPTRSFPVCYLSPLNFLIFWNQLLFLFCRERCVLYVSWQSHNTALQRMCHLDGFEGSYWNFGWAGIIILSNYYSGYSLKISWKIIFFKVGFLPRNVVFHQGLSLSRAAENPQQLSPTVVQGGAHREPWLFVEPNILLNRNNIEFF